jgi:hypothetical protein
MMDNREIAQALVEMAEALVADVGDVEIVEPVESKPVKTRRTKKVKATRGEPLSVFDVETADDLVDDIRSGIDAPFANAKKSTLGGKDRVTVLAVISLDPRSEWSNGILENSRYARFHIDNDGVIEMFSGGWRGMPKKFRKSVAKDAKDVVRLLNRWVKQNQRTASDVGIQQPMDERTPEFKSWFRKCQKMVETHEKRDFPGLPYESELAVQKGRRYLRIVKRSGPSESAWAFVDKQTGDILKPASWRKPARHARGNIFDSHNGMKWMDSYGPAYLR